MKLYIISPDIPEKIKDVYYAFLKLDSNYFKHIYAFQLRFKVLYNIDSYEKYIIDIKNICKKNNIYFIINDNFDLMMYLNADGIHVGMDDDESYSRAKEYNKNNTECKKIIGISCYNQLKRGIDIMSHITYVSFGCFFSSQTKLNPIARPNPQIIEEWKKISSIPCIAIGGIDEYNIKTITDYKPNYIAISSYIWNSNNPIKALKLLVDILVQC
ncbi:MAG: thiamine phosphate synthase [Anaplasmataceae bacterium]|nr:thiamine phosphate synthase [Anaplasmataceae bacterium]